MRPRPRVRMPSPPPWLFFAALAAAASSLPAQTDMQTYTHSSGVSVHYPREWVRQEQPGLLLLVPPDLAKNAQGQPIELLMLGAQQTESVLAPDAPEVAAFFVEQLRQLLPHLAPSGTATAITCGLGPGAIHRFTGKDSTGLEMQARVLVTMHDGSGIFLAHLFPQTAAGARDAVTTAIFASLHLQAPARDPALVGSWKRTDYFRTSSTGALSGYGSMSNTTYIYFVFEADGAFAYITTSRTSGNTADLGVIANSSGSNVSKGRWRGTNGRVHIDYDDGAVEELIYEVWRDATMSGVRIGVPGRKANNYQRHQ